MTSEKKRIAILINTLRPGGAERAVSNLSRQLSSRFDIDIILNNSRQVDFPYQGRIISLDVHPGKDPVGALYQFRVFFRRIRLLKKLKETQKYAAVLSFSEMSNFANAVCRDMKSRSIISCRNSVRKTNGKGLKYRFFSAFILPYCLKHTDLTVSCSKEIAYELTTRYGLPPDRSRVIYNGLDPEYIHKLAEEQLLKEDAEWMAEGLQIVSVGRLTAQKGHWHLIRAVNQLRKEGMNVKLSIVGEGELREKLRKLIRETGSSDNIRLTGIRKNPFSLMARADAVVFPSLYEGFSNAVTEALACGIPCISTDHSTGAREILAPDSDFRKKVMETIEYAPFGVLVPVPDGSFHEADEPITPEEALMADAIREILTNKKLSEGYRAAAPKRADSLNIRSIADQWSDLIEEKETAHKNNDPVPYF